MGADCLENISSDGRNIDESRGLATMEKVDSSDNRNTALRKMPSASTPVFAYAYVYSSSPYHPAEGFYPRPCAKRIFQTAQSRERGNRKTTVYNGAIPRNLLQQDQIRDIVRNVESIQRAGNHMVANGVFPFSSIGLRTLEGILYLVASYVVDLDR